VTSNVRRDLRDAHHRAYFCTWRGAFPSRDYLTELFCAYQLCVPTPRRLIDLRECQGKNSAATAFYRQPKEFESRGRYGLRFEHDVKRGDASSGIAANLITAHQAAAPGTQRAVQKCKSGMSVARDDLSVKLETRLINFAVAAQRSNARPSGVKNDSPLASSGTGSTFLTATRRPHLPILVPRLLRPR